MAGVMNKTARQFNLKTVNKKTGARVTVRVAPGFNAVNNDHWEPMKTDPYVKGLKDQGLIDFGSKLDDMELEQDPDTESKSKSVTLPAKSK